MFSLALSTLRFRTTSFSACFINVFLGSAILMAFASLFDSGTAAGVSSADRGTLITMALVVSSWGIIIVAFGIAATMNLSVRQRSTEIALLKSVGATPSQIGHMIMGETAVVSGVAAIVAIPAAFLAGRVLLSSLISTHQVANGVDYHFGFIALGIGLGDTLVASAIAAYFTARRASRLNTTDALISAAIESPRIGKKRMVSGLICLVIGINCAILVATILKGKGFTTESLAGEADIWTSIGFALLAPALMRIAGRLFGFILRRLFGASGYLADVNIRQRTSQMAGVLMPSILFTGIAAGSLYMQSVLNRVNASNHIVNAQANKSVETLNFIIVIMIAVFAAVVLINIAITTTMYRKREFGQQRLIGSTPTQVLLMVGLETFVTAITGLFFGTIAALMTVLPFSFAINHELLPSVSPDIYIGVAVSVIFLAFIANLGAGKRAIYGPMLNAVAINS